MRQTLFHKIDLILDNQDSLLDLNNIHIYHIPAGEYPSRIRLTWSSDDIHGL